MRIKKIGIFALIFVAAMTVSLSACGSNGSKYDLTTIEKNTNALTGKTIYWLGSSVTYGFRSKGLSMADYVSARNGTTCVKEAVTGTTLIDITNKQGDSYVSRMKNSSNFSKETKIDAFVCQISTNDAKKCNQSLWGTVTADNVVEMKQFDTKTTFGAIEYIISYVEATWDCPIYFYSGARFDDRGNRSYSDPKGSDYEKLIEQTKAIAEKWNKIEGYDVRIIDLFHDEAFNDISNASYRTYMHDPVHPYRAGYLEWWTPAFEEVFLKDFS